MRLTLLIPDLLWPEPEDDLAYGPLPQATLPALETLLARGRRGSCQGAYEGQDQFGVHGRCPRCVLRLALGTVSARSTRQTRTYSRSGL